MNKTKVLVLLGLALTIVGLLLINSECQNKKLRRDVDTLYMYVDALEHYTKANLYKASTQILLTNIAHDNRAMRRELIDSLRSECKHYQYTLKK